MINQRILGVLSPCRPQRFLDFAQAVDPVSKGRYKKSIITMQSESKSNITLPGLQ
jgi:hypothetical protein